MALNIVQEEQTILRFQQSCQIIVAATTKRMIPT
jgi:hypothetical protein